MNCVWFNQEFFTLAPGRAPPLNFSF
jgi:hypothetical protein